MKTIDNMTNKKMSKMEILDEIACTTIITVVFLSPFIPFFYRTLFH